jgi:hypothetical protein
MSAAVLQLNFKYDVSKDDYISAVSPLVEHFTSIPGLRWKIWMINADETEAGGIYLFDDVSRVQAFLESDLAATVTSHPAFREFRLKMFDVMPDQSITTRAPIEGAAGSRKEPKT